MNAHLKSDDLPGFGGCLPETIHMNALRSKDKHTNKLNRLDDLRSLYRSTFGEWASQEGRFQGIRDSDQEGCGIEEARVRATEAEAAYRDVRNRLVDEMQTTPIVEEKGDLDV